MNFHMCPVRETTNRKSFESVSGVVKWRLCIGCGVCINICPENAISLVDIVDQGLRAKVHQGKCEKCGECVKVCPGIGLSHPPFTEQIIRTLSESWGPVLEVWEGYASDNNIRFMGSSGGITTALALFCLEKGYAKEILHVGANPNVPWQNIPAYSRNKENLLKCTGSRYSPAAPCLGFNRVVESDWPWVFIGKPCDVAALRKSQKVSHRLEKNVCLAISCFCASTPTTKATENLLAKLGVSPSQVEELRYRGLGWPGKTRVKLKDMHEEYREMNYEQSWGNILSNYGQYRCRLCPDSTGEFADIACGDAWHREVEADDPGRSVVLVRTELGKEFLRKAMEAGYLQLERADPDILPLSQQALLRRRSHLWGRLLVMRLMWIPVPRYIGFSLFKNWLRLSAKGKLRSLVGTLRRIVRRRWTKPIRLFDLDNKIQEDNWAR
jgi:coenzyme F420 hydrogenase subunit beta